MFKQRGDHRAKVKVDFFSGFLSGFITVTICSPLDVARTRLNLMQITEYGKNKYNGFFNTLSTIYKEEGLKGMYSGYKVTVLATPLFHSIFFSVYNFSRPYVQKWFPEKYNFIYTEISCSLIAGFVSDFLTNPLWVYYFYYFILSFFCLMIDFFLFFSCYFTIFSKQL